MVGIDDLRTENPTKHVTSVKKRAVWQNEKKEDQLHDGTLETTLTLL